MNGRCSEQQALFHECLQFESYADLVSHAMKSEKNAELWYGYLRLKRKRADEIDRLIRLTRKTNPGLADYEIIQKHEAYLSNNFPVPVFKECTS